MLTPEEEARKARLLQELNDLEDGARDRFRRDANKGYSFAGVANPEALAKLQSFQRIFGRYFPRLRKSEARTITLHQALSDGIFGHPIPTINKSTFEADLKRFRRAIKVLADWPIWKTMIKLGYGPAPCDDFEKYYAMVRDLRSRGFAVDQQMTDVENAALKIFECLVTIKDMDDEKQLPQVLNQLERWARETSEDLPDRRNINWQAVNAVHELTAYWESEAESPPPPRALNPASPFADYLRDGFQFFEISGDPIAAFKRWVVVEEFWREIRIRKWK